MPANPQDAARFIRDSRFQSLDPQAQLASFRQFLAASDDEYAQHEADDPHGAANTAKQILDFHQPGFASKVADVAEYVPVVGGAVTGYRAAEAGEPARPLTRILSGGYEATSPVGRAFQEAGRDVAELAAAEGVTRVAAPAISALAERLAGGVVEGAAERVGVGKLVEQAFRAPTLEAARPIAGAAARAALRQRIVEHGLSQLTAGEAFGVLNAVERGVAGGEPAPLQDFVATPLGVAALGMGFFGLGELASRFGVRSAQELAAEVAARDPERLAAMQGDLGQIIERVRGASAGRLDRPAAADLTFRALTEPIAAVGDVQVLKDALRRNPELLGTEAGMHLLRTQRTLAEPDVTVVGGPYLRVTFDDENGRSVTQDLTGDTPGQRALRQRIAEGRITVDTAVGDQASLLRSGVRSGEPLAEVVPPGGGAPRMAQEVRPLVAGEGAQLPAVIDQPSELAQLVEQGGRELRANPGYPALPAPEGEYGLLGNEYVRVRPGAPAPPPIGTTARTAAGENVRVIGDADPLNRAVVELPGGNRARVQWSPLGHFEVPPSLLTLPERRGVAPALTEGVMPITPAFREQVRAGQLIHQTTNDLGKRGPRPSIEILRVDGDRVLARSGDTVIDTTIDQVARTVESGAGRFAFDMTKAPTDILETMNERFAPRVREPLMGTTPESIARDAQLAEDLWSFERQMGQEAAPATLARNEGDGLARARERRKNRPQDERTQSKSDLVKGCKR